VFKQNYPNSKFLEEGVKKERQWWKLWG
jgi:outer membrane protein assembly factor BamD